MKRADVILKRERTSFSFFRAVFTVFVLYGLVVLEGVFPRNLSFFGAIPNITLTFIILFSLNQKGIFSLVISAASGLFLDLASGKAIPIDSILYLYISFWCVWIQKKMYIEGLKRCATAVFVFTILGRLPEAVFFSLFKTFFLPSVSALLFQGAANVLSIVWIGPLVKLCTKERGEKSEKNG